jgi:hypothetical protein
MKLQRYSWDSVYEDFDQETKWVKASDAEALELAVERATANMVAAQTRCAELEELNDKLKRELEKALHILSKGIA